MAINSYKKQGDSDCRAPILAKKALLSRQTKEKSDEHLNCK
ncbi:hypothetical protein [Enterococcus xiangfangensis]